MNEKNIETNEPEEIEKVEPKEATEKSAWKQKPMVFAASILAVVLFGRGGSGLDEVGQRSRQTGSRAARRDDG